MDDHRHFRPNGKRRKTKTDEQKYREQDKQVKGSCNEAKEHRIITLSEFGINEITKLFKIVHDTDKIPNDLKSQCELQYPQNRHN